jgi:hypothetical protein
LWGVTEAELDRRELVATTRPVSSPQKTIKNPLRGAAGEAGSSKKVVKRKRAAGEGRVMLKLPRVVPPPRREEPPTPTAPLRDVDSRLRRDLASAEDRIEALRREESASRASAGALQERLRAAEQRNAQLEGRMADVQEEARAMEHALAQALTQRSPQRFEQLQRRLDCEFLLILRRSRANGVL